MARKYLIRGAVAAAAIGLVAIPVARAQMAVFDGTSFGELIQQFNAIQQQIKTALDTLNVTKEISQIQGEVHDAIGPISQITLAIPNITNMATQLRGDMQCLIPQVPSWGLNLSDLNFGNLCDLTSKYRDALFIDKSLPAILSGTSSVSLEATERTIAQRREALAADTAVRALAEADVALNKQVQNLTSAADDLQTSLNASQTMQDRLQVLGQIGLLQVRATAEQNQLLGQMLKLQATTAVAQTRADQTLVSVPTSGGQ